jgi:hypothetical protein
MKYIRDLLGLAVVLAVAALMLCHPANAQTAIQLPQYIDNSGPKDFGNGPVELKFVLGSAVVVTSQGFGTVSSAAGTLITLQSTPTNLPCVDSLIATNTVANCAISGPGITSGTLIGSFRASTGTGTGTGPVIGVTNLQPALLAVGSQVGWGAACPTTQSGPAMAASVGSAFPLYTTARICGYSAFGPGAQVLPFPIGAH